MNNLHGYKATGGKLLSGSILLFLAAALFSAGCLERSVTTGFPGRDTDADTPSRDRENPGLVEYALGELAGDRDFVLPKSKESYYRLVGRFPVIDLLGANPFTLPAFGVSAAESVSDASSASGLFASASAAAFVEDFSPVRVAIGEKTGHRPEPPRKPGDIPPSEKLARILDLIVPSMGKAFILCSNATSALTQAELESLENNLGSYFYESGELVFLTAPVAKKAVILNTVRKIELGRFFEAELALAAAVDSCAPLLDQLSREFVPEDDELLVDAEFGWGRLLVGGTGRNEYSKDAALIIDIGGDDVYCNNAGSACGVGLPAALVIDMNGNDVYMRRPLNQPCGSASPGSGSQPLNSRLSQVKAADRSLQNSSSAALDTESDEAAAAATAPREPLQAVQGAGFLGAGLLVDMKGDDIYDAGGFSQGAGYIGCGMLLDYEGDDRYSGGRFVQGAGLFGCGVLADLDGDDAYSAEQLAQGFGSTVGVGVLHDRRGDDRFEATSPSYGFAQGSGCGCRSYPWLMDYSIYGGIGFLVDDAGDDTYDAASFSQGASYFLSFGALIDRGGDDAYSGRGSYSHGAGVHLTSGLFIDFEGDDAYTGKWAGGAVGNDRSAGIFIDVAGDDTYSAPSGDGQGYSHKPRGFSLFIDASGDDDYDAADHSQAYVLPPIIPDAWGTAIFIDAEGRDSYSMPGRADETAWGRGTHAVGLDAEISAYDPFTELDRIAARMGGGTGITETYEKPCQASPGFADPCAYQVLAGEMVEEFRRDPTGLVNRLSKGDAVSRRAAEEALTTLLLSDDSGFSIPSAIGEALTSPDPRSRAFAAILIDLHEVAAAGGGLLAAAASDPDPYVRRQVLRAIGNLRVHGGDTLLVRTAVSDPDRRCRGMALFSLARYEDPAMDSAIIKILEDRSEHVYVRFAAASALGRTGFPTAAPGQAGSTAAVVDRTRRNDAIESLRNAAAEPDPYMKKAAGEALLQLGCRDGLRPLIDYLDFRALDTSSDNYGSNIGAVLLEYTNVDFGRDREKWLEWAEMNGESFPLEQNLESRKLYIEAVRRRRKGDEDGAAAAFENALAANPDYLKVKLEYAAMLNSRAWGMVTSPTEKTDPVEGLKLARRCVELDPDPMYIDTLAEACFRNGLLQEAIRHGERALELDPDSSEYRTRLARFRKASNE